MSKAMESKWLWGFKTKVCRWMCF